MRKLHRPLSDKVEVRVTADTSYQIKRAMEAVTHEKGLEMMSRSGIKKNNRRRDENQPLLREHATFRDLKFEKHDQRKKKNLITTELRTDSHERRRRIVGAISFTVISMLVWSITRRTGQKVYGAMM